MLEFFCGVLFFLGFFLFFGIIFTDIEWLCTRSKVFSCPLCMKRKAQEEKEVKEDKEK